jgi:hypothetical protein
MTLHPNAQYTSHQLPTCRPPYWCFGSPDLTNFAGGPPSEPAHPEPCQWVPLDMETWACKWCRHVHTPEALSSMPRELAAAVPMRWTPPAPRPESRMRRWSAVVRERIRQERGL